MTLAQSQDLMLMAMIALATFAVMLLGWAVWQGGRRRREAAEAANRRSPGRATAVIVTGTRLDPPR